MADNSEKYPAEMFALVRQFEGVFMLAQPPIQVEDALDAYASSVFPTLDAAYRELGRLNAEAWMLVARGEKRPDELEVEAQVEEVFVDQDGLVAGRDPEFDITRKEVFASHNVDDLHAKWPAP